MREIKRETREMDRKREREWCEIFLLVNMECGGLQIPVTQKVMFTKCKTIIEILGPFLNEMNPTWNGAQC